MCPSASAPQRVGGIKTRHVMLYDPWGRLSTYCLEPWKSGLRHC